MLQRRGGPHHSSADDSDETADDRIRISLRRDWGFFYVLGSIAILILVRYAIALTDHSVPKIVIPSMPQSILANDVVNRAIEKWSDHKWMKHNGIFVNTCEKSDDPCYYTRTNKSREGKDISVLSYARNAKEERILRLLEGKTKLDNELKALLDGIAHDKDIILMVANDGYVDLILNWILSCRIAKVNIDNLLVFSATQHSHDIMKGMRVASYFAPSILGEFPRDASAGYGDDVFMSLMWLKTVSVWAVIRQGFNVLFQDADLVWFADPFPYLTHEYCMFKSTGEPTDVLFMHDGASSNRFAPYWGNSGFFYLRATDASRQFWDAVTYGFDMQLSWSSQQAVVDHIAGDYCSLGLKVNTLCERLFANGRISLEYIGNIMPHDGFVPILFHINWTLNSTEKIERMKKLGIWYLGPDGSLYLACIQPIGEPVDFVVWSDS